jgi:large subunit ribosomal protein L24e
MKVELCHFSGAKILPSRGKKYVRVDGKSFNFLNGKCERSFMMRRNPRKTSWTVVYRRKNKKGSVEEVVKKRSRRTTKAYRPITGATLESILQKRNQKPEVRKAQREEAIRAAKEKATAKKKSKVQQAQKLAQKAQMRQNLKSQKIVKGARSSGKRF